MRFGLVRGTAFASLLLVSTVAFADPPSPSPTAGGATEAAKPGAAGPSAAGPGAATPGNASPKAADTNTAKPGALKPDVATLLFGTPQWTGVPPGAKLRYTYDKVVADPSLGIPFKDEVVLTVGAGDDATSRTAEMQLFTGEHRKPAGPFRSDGQNPVLLVILEDSVQEMSKLFKANPRYLKNAIRKAWRDNARIEPAHDTVDGKPVAVTRITVAPFVNDPESDKMKGLQTMTYVVDVSDDVPGTITAIDIRALSQAKVLFAETLRFASETKP